MSNKKEKKLDKIDLDSLSLPSDSPINSKLYPDGNSLYLKVLKNGKKYWHVQYTFEGKTSFTSVGVYPKVSLKKARELCEEIHKKIDNGVHPLAEKRKKVFFYTFYI